MKHAVSATWFLDTENRTCETEMAVVVSGSSIERVMPRARLLAELPNMKVTHFEGCTILPGLVNCHSHLLMPGDGTAVEQMANLRDEQLYQTALENARLSLASGVTTLADLGAKNDVTFRLREHIKAGMATGPRLILCGTALTSPRGHLWPFGGEVCDEDELKSEARRLFDRGADILKVLASGGGTSSSNLFAPQFDSRRLEAAVLQARSAGKKAFGHCTCKAATSAALLAGFDVICHGLFFDACGHMIFDQALAESALQAQVIWNPTLYVARGRNQILRSLRLEHEHQIRKREQEYEVQAEHVQKVYEMGIPIAAGSDEGWSYNRFGQFAREIDSLQQAGLSCIDALAAGTIVAAKALGVDENVGSLAPGKMADMLVAEGNVATDVGALSNIREVFYEGTRVNVGSYTNEK